MTHKQDPRQTHGDYLEWQFVLDYASFGMRINFEAVIVLYEKALSITDTIKQKSLCLSGMQLMFSSWEDFALLLQSFIRRKNEGLHLYRYLVGEQQKQGSSDVPSKFKRFTSAREMLDELGFTSVTYRFLSRYYLAMSKSEFESHFKEFARSVRGIGRDQQENNETKNILKHGKGVVEGDVHRTHPECIAYIKWVKEDGEWKLELQWVIASLEQLKVAVIHTAKLYERSMELLWLFMIQYHPNHAQELFRIYKEQVGSCVSRVKALGIKSKGLTY